MQENFDFELLKAGRVDENYDEPVLHQIIRIAIYDEYKAYETYKKVIEKFGVVQPFANIMQAEINHFEALSQIAQKYEVPLPMNDFEGKIQAPRSLLEAAEIGVVAEIENIKTYDDLIPHAVKYPDLLDVIYRLQAASYNNHLPALRQSVAKYSNPDFGVNEPFSQAQSADKINELNEMFAKFSKGEVSNEEIMKLLSNTNVSFIGGALLGAVGAMMLSQTKNDGAD
jgi:hypothetical protein